MRQLKLSVISLPVGVMLVSFILFSQVFTAVASSSDRTDKELKDKDIKQKSKSSETNLNDEDNIGKQEERESQDNVMVDNGDDNNNSSGEEDDVPFELPFDNIIPFP
jgi:lipopolysaccharide export LptBFGC system permease protein LptF